MSAEILELVKTQAGNIEPINSKLKFMVGDDAIMVDGTGESNVVTDSNDDADCVISCSAETFMKLKSGDLNPMMAVMSGKVKIKGDMGLAMKVQSLI